MKALFDHQKWHDSVTTRYDWYRVIFPEFEAILKEYEGSPIALRDDMRDQVYGFFEERLARGNVLLGSEGKNWDEERKPIDTIVIHHTKGREGMTWQRLSAMHLLRLYSRSYLSPSTEKEIEGMPVWSNHFRDKQMVFYGYHFIVRSDGSVERLLPDEAIGWQAGNWDINCRSVGICLDGAFENTPPPQAMIEGAKKVIKEHYVHVASERIIPHRKANPATTCPGGWFEGVGW